MAKRAKADWPVTKNPRNQGPERRCTCGIERSVTEREGSTLKDQKRYLACSIGLIGAPRLCTSSMRSGCQLLEAADEAFGFFCYHLAEHHATPLGMAPSPALFLAAAAQRTRRIRLGPLVYLAAAVQSPEAYRRSLHAGPDVQRQAGTWGWSRRLHRTSSPILASILLPRAKSSTRHYKCW